MDKLYIGDIPKEYCYARFNSNYIDLYNTSLLTSGNTYTFYRVYLYENQFMYEQLQTTTGGYYSTQYNTFINVTDDVFYRRDMPSILCMTFIFAIGFVFLINLVTSFVKRGGLLHGLF